MTPTRVASVPHELHPTRRGTPAARPLPWRETQRDALALAGGKEETFSPARQRGCGDGFRVASARLKVRDGDCTPGEALGQRSCWSGEGVWGVRRVRGNQRTSSSTSCELRYPPERGLRGGREGFSGMKACRYNRLHRDTRHFCGKGCCKDNGKRPGVAQRPPGSLRGGRGLRRRKEKEVWGDGGRREGSGWWHGGAACAPPAHIWGDWRAGAGSGAAGAW